MLKYKILKFYSCHQNSWMARNLYEWLKVDMEIRTYEAVPIQLERQVNNYVPPTEVGNIHRLILTQFPTYSITFAPPSNVYMQFGKCMFAVFSTALYQQSPMKKAHTGRNISDSTQVLLKFTSGRDTCYCRWWYKKW